MDQTGIANLTLGRLGIGQAIASIDDQINPAKICKRFYDQCRQEVLRAFPWPIAYRATALSLVADQTFPGWAYVYANPASCLYVRAVSDSYGLRFARTIDWTNRAEWPAQMRYPWQQALKDDNASTVILSDLQNAYAFYTVDLENTAAFTADLCSIIAWRLAMEVGGPLLVNANLVERAKQEYLFWQSHTTAAARNESQSDPRQESPSIVCRN